jgi:Ca2+-binding EF-hand superfamily protein
MSRWLLGMAAVVLVLLALVTMAREPVSPEAPGTVRDVVYFGAAGPLRIRLHVTIGGKPAEAVWEQAVAGLFAFLDRNGDGKLDATERSVISEPRRGRPNNPVILDGAGAPLRLTFESKEEVVTRKAFAAAIRAAEFEAVRLASTVLRADSAQLSAALFRHLDQNHDGKLSADELRAARERLSVLDANEDELLTPAELLGQPISTNAVRPVAVAGMQRSSDEAEKGLPDLLFLASDLPAAVKQVLVARGGEKAKSLSRSDFRADAKAFAALDKDGNGRLDLAELTAWLQQPPDAEIMLALGPGKVSLLPPGTGRSSVFHTEPGGTLFGSIPGTRLRFEPPNDGSLKAAWDTTADRLRQQFVGLAKAKGVVTRKQLENQPAAQALFDFADRNADGKVDPAEVEQALKVLAPLATCRVQITFVDGGNGLFELLDRNGDGQLSPRELIEAAAVLRPFADAGGRVGPKDLPREIRIQTTAAGIPAVVSPPPLPSMARRDNARPASTESVPAWFTKMDRNGDGDVSLREFLGPLELFHKLDRNGDGLISPEEARAGPR